MLAIEKQDEFLVISSPWFILININTNKFSKDNTDKILLTPTANVFLSSLWLDMT